MTERVLIFDTTLRDGEQSPGASMTITEKLMLAEQLERLRVDVIEAGFPISSEGDFESVRASPRRFGPSRSPDWRGPARGISIAAGRLSAAPPSQEFIVFIATSDIHLKYKLKKSREEVLEEARQMVAYAKSFVPMWSSRPRIPRAPTSGTSARLWKPLSKRAPMLSTFPIPSVIRFPTEYAERISYLRSHVPNIEKTILSVHCHNDLGLAVANSLTAIQNGVRQVECTVNGIGERAGNASLEEIVMALHTRKDLFGIETGINTEEIYPSSSMVTNLTGMIVQPNKAIVGRNAFAHEAGIHQDGMIKEKLTYEIMRPEDVGIKESKLVMGKHSGRHALRKKYRGTGVRTERCRTGKALTLLKKVADKKKDVVDEDSDCDSPRCFEDCYPRFTNSNTFSRIGGNQIIATATIVLEKEANLPGFRYRDGPVDAVLKAVDRITGIEGKLIEYTVRSVYPWKRCGRRGFHEGGFRQSLLHRQGRQPGYRRCQCPSLRRCRE